MKKIFYLGIIFLLFGCYKKDLEEFKNIEKLTVEENLAFPLFNATVELNDSLNIPNFSFYDTLYLMNDGSEIEDKITLSFDGYNVKDVELKLYIENTFPIETYLQIYFLDDQDNLTDSLFNIEKLRITNTEITEMYLDMNPEKYKKMVNCKTMKTVLYLKKMDSYSSNYRMFIGCGVKAKVEKTF